jgi:hypothetical protein
MVYSPSSHNTGQLSTLSVWTSELCHALNISSVATLNTSSGPLILVADIANVWVCKVSESMPDSVIRGEVGWRSRDENGGSLC